MCTVILVYYAIKFKLVRYWWKTKLFYIILVFIIGFSTFYYRLYTKDNFSIQWRSEEWRKSRLYLTGAHVSCIYFDIWHKEGKYQSLNKRTYQQSEMQWLVLGYMLSFIYTCDSSSSNKDKKHGNDLMITLTEFFVFQRT